MNASNNILQFPIKHHQHQKQSQIITPDQLIQESALSLEEVKASHIQETLELILPRLFDGIHTAGFHLYDETENGEAYHKDVSFIVEGVISLMSKYYDIQHPFQKLAENLFNEKEEGVYELNKSINLDFSDEELENFNGNITENEME
jgi:hypothetical protein